MLDASLCYEAYGAVLRTNVAWPALTPIQASVPEAITITVERLAQLPPCPRPDVVPLQGRRFHVTSTHPHLQLRVDDFLHVLLDEANCHIRCWVTDQANDRIVEYWLLRQILPIARLCWHSIEILHAGAVRIDNEVAAFLAPSYTGKSTLVGCFVNDGYTLITDDHLVLQRHEANEGAPVWVFPALPYYRDHRAFETLGRHTHRYDPAPCRLRAIYVMERAQPEAAVRISPLPNADAAVELLHQTPNLLSRVPRLSAVFPQRFAFISNLPLNVHVRRLAVPRSLERLHEVAERITADFRRLRGIHHVPIRKDRSTVHADVSAGVPALHH
jgi:hypothetical protein